MDQSLGVFRDSFHSFYIFGVQKCKKATFLVKNSFWCIFIQLKRRGLRTGPGDFKYTKHLKFDLRQIFAHL